MKKKKKAKNLHRSLFGRFRQFMEYKAEKFGKTLILADRFYPSTQRCSNCGMSKLVMRKSPSVEIKNMVLNIMNMFVTPAVMKMTVITMQC